MPIDLTVLPIHVIKVLVISKNLEYCKGVGLLCSFRIAISVLRASGFGKGPYENSGQNRILVFDPVQILYADLRRTTFRVSKIDLNLSSLAIDVAHDANLLQASIHIRLVDAYYIH